MIDWNRMSREWVILTSSPIFHSFPIRRLLEGLAPKDQKLLWKKLFREPVCNSRQAAKEQAVGGVLSGDLLYKQVRIVRKDRLARLMLDVWNVKGEAWE